MNLLNLFLNIVKYNYSNMKNITIISFNKTPLKRLFITNIKQSCRLLEFSVIEECIGFIEVHHQRIHAVFIDYFQNNVDGYDLYVLIKKNYADLSVFLTFSNDAIRDFFNNKKDIPLISSLTDLNMFKKKIL